MWRNREEAYANEYILWKIIIELQLSLHLLLVRKMLIYLQVCSYFPKLVNSQIVQNIADGTSRYVNNKEWTKNS